MLEAILIPRIRKCTPKSFPTPISQRAKTYWPFILNNVLLLFITRKNISCETMRHVMVYNVWYDYSLSPNILPRQVLLYLIYHERVHCTVIVCPVWRLWVLRGERPGLRQREGDILLGAECALLSCTVYCALHSTVHSWIQGLGSERQRVGQTRDQGLPSELSPDNICCSSLPPDLQKCDSVCDKLWQIVTVCDMCHAEHREYSSTIRNLSQHFL